MTNTTTTLIDKYKVTLQNGRTAVITPEYIEDGPETAFEKGFAFYASAVPSGRNIVFAIQTNEMSRIPESAFNLAWNARNLTDITVGMFVTDQKKVIIAGTLNHAMISHADMLTILFDLLDGEYVDAKRLTGEMDWRVKSGNGYTMIFTDNTIYSFVLSGNAQILRVGDPIAHGEILTREAFERMAEGSEVMKPFDKLPIAPQVEARIGAALHEAMAVKALAA
jgi:tRNA(Arg) A34 adenosine deaminase TadA